MGRVPLPRLQGRRRGRAAGQIRQAARPLFPRDGRGARCAAKPDGFVLDGELMVPRGDRLSFGALQDRLHPAESRIRKLAAETPALLVLFDCLADAGRPDPAGGAAARPPGRAGARRGRLRPRRPGSACRRCTARPRARRRAGSTGRGGALDGVVAKRRDGPMRRASAAMLKVKTHPQRRLRGGRVPLRHAARARSARCCWACTTPRAGSTMSASPRRSADADRPALTERLEALRGRRSASPATRRAARAGGRPSASATWEKLRPELVVEVQLRPGHRRAVPPRHAAAALAPGQGARAMHTRADRRGGSGRASWSKTSCDALGGARLLAELRADAGEARRLRLRAGGRDRGRADQQPDAGAGTELFRNVGVEPTRKRIVVVKSTNHFHAALGRSPTGCLYVDSDGPLPRQYRAHPVHPRAAPAWPLTRTRPAR